MMHDVRYQQAKQVTFIGAFINALLGFIKLMGGMLFHSHALIADGVHSFSDLFTDVMVIFASKYGSQDADETHPYGHQRIETAATLLLSLLLILAGAGIAWDALSEIIHHTHHMPGWLSLPIAVLSILANEGLFHYTQHIGKQIQSTLILANAWHHRSDAAASIVVLIGLIGSLAGFTYLDAFAAIIVGLMIIQMGFSYGWSSVKELVDTAIDPTMLNTIEQLILKVSGVVKIHQLRSRSMAGDIFIDVHVLVSPYLSVSEGHYIAQHVHMTLLKQLPNIKDVTVHVDPEDDETTCPSLYLPNRQTLEHELLIPLQQKFPQIQTWTLHYLDGKLSIDIILSQPFDKNNPLIQSIKKTLLNKKNIKEIRIFYQTCKIA